MEEDAIERINVKIKVLENLYATIGSDFEERIDKLEKLFEHRLNLLEKIFNEHYANIINARQPLVSAGKRPGV